MAGTSALVWMGPSLSEQGSGQLSGSTKFREGYEKLGARGAQSGHSDPKGPVGRGLREVQRIANPWGRDEDGPLRPHLASDRLLPWPR